MRVRGVVIQLLLALLAGAVAAGGIAISGAASGPRMGQELAPGGIGALSAGAPEDFVGSAACADCHAAETKAWLSSQHAHAMSRAEPQTVLGDFNNVQITQDGSSARFFRDGERFMVETEGAEGRPATFEISDTFGLHPLQQYLVTLPDGRRQALRFAYDTRGKEEGGQRWFALLPGQQIPPSDPLHWTGPQQNWNFMCAECHSTALRKGYDAATNRFDTHFSEISVGCEACHGPGKGHLNWARGARDPAVAHSGFAAVAAVRPPADWSPNPATGSPAHGVTRPEGDEVETCARCHSRRGILSEAWRPGHPLAETHQPSVLARGLFEADGQMQDEVFNDQTFKQSLMYARGVTCGDCHDPHSAQLRAPGSAVCAQCHQPDRFASPQHTGHPEGPKSPDCISCHMPKRTYMVVDARHDHSFRIPRPDLSARLGTPNACTDCHGDKPASWAAEAVERWHGPQRKGFQTWGEALHEAREGDAAAREKLIALAASPETPAVVRATAITELQGFPASATDAAVRRALADPDPQVRSAALEGQAGLPLDVRWRRVSPLLTDPVAGVRIEAANQLADQPLAPLSPDDRQRLEAAFAEYVAAQRLNADRVEGRANLGGFLARRGDPAGAEAQFLAGLKLEPGHAALSVNLADLYRQQGREAEAQAVLKTAIAAHPDAADAHHALALSLIRQRNYPAAVGELDAAARLAPDNARYAYVYAVALKSLGRAADGAAIASAALRRNPNDAGLLTLALNAALQAGDRATARSYVVRLLQLRPDDAELMRLDAQLK